jgi:hypothetical protein
VNDYDKQGKQSNDENPSAAEHNLYAPCLLNDNPHFDLQRKHSNLIMYQKLASKNVRIIYSN